MPADPSETSIRRGDPADVGIDRRVLDGSLARLCAANATRAAALVVRGRLVWERYWDGCDESTRFCAFSVTKGLVASAIGLLEADGVLSLDDPASRFLTEWAGDARRAITIRHLLTMTSGLALDFPRFVGAPDPTAAALAWPLMHLPGSTWCYEQATAQALAPIIVRASGREPFDLLRERVLGPIGAASIEAGVTETRVPMAYSGALTTARDLTRVGELLLARGRFAGRALLDERFVRRMIAVDPVTTASRADPARDDYRRRGYGFFVDTNIAGMWPGVGPDAFALVGAWCSVCLVDPTHDFVFVRLVVPEGRDADADLDGSALAVTDHGTARLWRAVLAAFDPGASLVQSRRGHAAAASSSEPRVASARASFDPASTFEPYRTFPTREMSVEYEIDRGAPRRRPETRFFAERRSAPTSAAGAKEVTMNALKFLPVATIAVVLGTGTARAEGPAPAPAVTVAADGSAIDFFGVSRFFTTSKSLGDAWEHAVHAVLDSMRTHFEAVRAALVVAPPPTRRNVVWPVPATLEVGSARKVVKLHPIKVEPVTQTVGDTRGQSAVLLGGSVELPWLLP